MGRATSSRSPPTRTSALPCPPGTGWPDGDRVSKSESIMIAAIKAGVPLLVEAREIIAAF